MMRFQRVSPGCIPVANGRKSSMEARLFRFGSPSRIQGRQNAISPTHSENLLLQWGQKKRTRASRSDARNQTDESSSSGQFKQPVSKASTRMANAILFPPPSTRHSGPAHSSFHRNLEKTGGAGNGSPSSHNNGISSSRVASRSMTKKPTPEKDKHDTKIPPPSKQAVAREEKKNIGFATQADLMHRVDYSMVRPEQEPVTTTIATTAATIINPAPAATPLVGAGGETVSHEVVEWPRIYVALSRKEKEDDFFAMKGTKLPQRPKKRAKNVDKTLQYCFPGMFLSDLTKSRYEVREKKTPRKQKKKGLKGMENLDSDSD